MQDPKEIRYPNKSNAAKLRNQNPEYIRKQRESHLGKPLNLSEAVRKAASDRVKANPPHKGHKHTEESIQKMRDNRKGKGCGENNSNFGKPVSVERKQKQQASMRLKVQTDEHKEKNRLTHIGSENHFYGKHHKEESKIKVSATKQGVPINEWDGFITPINHYVRTHPRYKAACSNAMKDSGFEDIFTCVKGTRQSPIECHHKIPHNMIMKLYNITTKEEADACDLLFDKHNLLVMLKTAHDRFHNLYGDDKNIYELTPEQIQELYT
jgi:hypothetical protein